MLEVRSHLHAPRGQVNGQQTQGAALEAVASLCRRVEGDIVTDLPLLCDRALALLWLGTSKFGYRTGILRATCYISYA